MGNRSIITNFYSAFSNHDAKTMAACYHPEIEFQDPVFGMLRGSDVSDMWTMLIQRSGGQLSITFSDVVGEGDCGSANWTAHYVLSKTGRKVVNRINAEFRFKDGLIVHHKDDFDFWKWSHQALGLKGMLLGWTSFFQDKISKQARLSLEDWQRKRRSSTIQ